MTNTYPITQFDDGRYGFTVMLDHENTSYYNLYINYLSTEDSEPSVVWDFFSSAQLYVYLPTGYKIDHATYKFKTLIMNHVLNAESSFTKHPFDLSTTPFSFATPVSSPTDPFVNAWKLEFDLFFSSSFDASSISQSAPSYHPPCKYYTKQSVAITSKYYSFANVPNDLPFCSCPNLSSTSSPSICDKYTFPDPDFSIKPNCSYYSYEKNLILSKSYTPSNTTSSHIISLFSLPSNDSVYTFEIFNETTGVLISSLTYPSTSEYDEIIKEVHSIYNEYLSCYNSDEISLTSQNQKETSSKTSYISTLLGV